MFWMVIPTSSWYDWDTSKLHICYVPKCLSKLTRSRYLSQYIIVGDRFYDKDTILSLYNVMQVPEHALDATGPNFHSINTLPDVTKLTALDPNGSFVLQASIEIADGGNPELKDKAAQQLLAMKETMRGSVILAPGDRLALDTRVPVRRVR